MDFQTRLDELNMTKYHLSKVSGIPKTTVLDLCAGRSSVERCSAKTVQQLAAALGCSMEDVMAFAPPATAGASVADTSSYDKNGLPKNKTYLECGLPPYLRESLEQMKAAWAKLDRGEKYYRWDCDFCSLQADINSAEVGGAITAEQAWYLRETYLRMERPGEIE